MKTMYARAWVRLMSYWGEPVWFAVNLGFPFLSSTAMALLYKSTGLDSFVGFAILGGIMVSFWGNVLWSMASQFNWDKQLGLFQLYLVSPAPLSAILMGMSVGGIVGTLPSAALVTFCGWLFFSPPISPSWAAVGLTFALTLSSLYSFGMVLSSVYLAYGREAESMNEALHDPVAMLSGVYFPTIGRFSPFPVGLQAAVSLIPLTVGMYALRMTLFFGQGVADIYPYLLALAAMAVVLLFAALRSLKLFEEKGRRRGTLLVRQA